MIINGFYHKYGKSLLMAVTKLFLLAPFASKSLFFICNLFSVLFVKNLILKPEVLLHLTNACKEHLHFFTTLLYNKCGSTH